MRVGGSHPAAERGDAGENGESSSDSTPRRQLLARKAMQNKASVGFVRCVGWWGKYFWDANGCFLAMNIEGLSSAAWTLLTLKKSTILSSDLR